MSQTDTKLPEGWHVDVPGEMKTHPRLFRPAEVTSFAGHNVTSRVRIAHTRFCLVADDTGGDPDFSVFDTHSGQSQPLEHPGKRAFRGSAYFTSACMEVLPLGLGVLVFFSGEMMHLVCSGDKWAIKAHLKTGGNFQLRHTPLRFEVVVISCHAGMSTFYDNPRPSSEVIVYDVACPCNELMNMYLRMMRSPLYEPNLVKEILKYEEPWSTHVHIACEYYKSPFIVSQNCLKKNIEPTQ